MCVCVCVYSENCGVRLIVEGVIWYSILAPIPSLSPLALMVMVTVCTYYLLAYHPTLPYPTHLPSFYLPTHLLWLLCLPTPFCLVTDLAYLSNCLPQNAWLVSLPIHKQFYLSHPLNLPCLAVCIRNCLFSYSTP